MKFSTPAASPTLAPLSPQPAGKKPATEKPADPLDIPANQAHARAHVREGHNSARAAALDFAARAADELDRLDAEIAALNARKATVFRELRQRGYDVATFRFQMREARLDPLLREERDRKRDAYSAIPFPRRQANGGAS